MGSLNHLQPSQKKALTTLLEDHSCLDDKENRDREIIITFIQEHDDAHLRKNKAGHLTGSALVLDCEGRVLLTHHRKLKKWLQVGGHGEGEWDPSDIALREACEESGLDRLSFHRLSPIHPTVNLRRPFDIDVHEIPAHGDECAHLHLDFRYVLVTDQSPDSILMSDESHELDWFSIEEALNLCDDHSLCRALRALKGSIAAH